MEAVVLNLAGNRGLNMALLASADFPAIPYRERQAGQVPNAAPHCVIPANRLDHFHRDLRAYGIGNKRNLHRMQDIRRAQKTPALPTLQQVQRGKERVILWRFASIFCPILTSRKLVADCNCSSVSRQRFRMLRIFKRFPPVRFMGFMDILKQKFRYATRYERVTSHQRHRTCHSL